MAEQGEQQSAEHNEQLEDPESKLPASAAIKDALVTAIDSYGERKAETHGIFATSDGRSLTIDHFPASEENARLVTIFDLISP